MEDGSIERSSLRIKLHERCASDENERSDCVTDEHKRRAFRTAHRTHCAQNTRRNEPMAHQNHGRAEWQVEMAKAFLCKQTPCFSHGAQKHTAYEMKDERSDGVTAENKRRAVRKAPNTRRNKYTARRKCVA